MPDRDAEIAAMVDEFLATGPRHAPGKPMSDARRMSSHRWARMVHANASKGFDMDAEETQIEADETPLDDVLHSGVIGTEE